MLGEYELLEVVGRGACGRVWRARHVATQAVVAVKVLREDLAEDGDVRARFRAEAALLAGRDLTGVVSVHGIVETGDRLALVMDLVDGPNLRQVLRERAPLPSAEACRMAAQMAAGLAAAHSADVVHRDLKPENVLIAQRDGKPLAVLTDFGIARLADGATLTRPSRVVGTPDYLAPEVATGRRATSAADVYALGVVLFESLTGWLPFRGEHVAAVIQQHLRGVLQRPDGLPDPLWALLEQTLDRSPERRSSATELTYRLTELTNALEGVPALARTDPPPPGPLEQERPGTVAVPVSVPATSPHPALGARLRQHPLKGGAAVAGALALVVLAGSAGYSALTPGAPSSTAALAGAQSEGGGNANGGSPGQPDSQEDRAEPPANGGPGPGDEAKDPAGAPAEPDREPPEQGAPDSGPQAADPLAAHPPKGGPPAAQKPLAPAPAPAPPKAPAPAPAPPKAPAPAPAPPKAPAPAPPPKPAPAPTKKQPAKPAPAVTQKYTPTQVCGRGFGVINQHRLPRSVVYLLWNSSTKENCVVTLKTADIGKDTPTTAYLLVEGNRTPFTDSGNYGYYADTRARAPECIKWGGSDGLGEFMSPPNVHCTS